MASQLRLQFRSFSEAAKPIASLMDDLDKEASLVLRNPAVRAKHTAVRSASIVLLSGFLESFMRQSAEVFFAELVRRGLAYSDLPSEMHKIHFVNGLQWAQKCAEKKEETDNLFVDTRATLSRLADPPAKEMPALIWEAFAVTKGNPGPKVITDYLRNFGVADGIRKIATESNSDQKLITTQLTSFILLRNECAHTGTSRNPPLPSDVRSFVHMLRQITLGISKTLDKRINELYAESTTARATKP